MLHVFEPCLSVAAGIAGELDACRILSGEVAGSLLKAKRREAHGVGGCVCGLGCVAGCGGAGDASVASHVGGGRQIWRCGQVGFVRVGGRGQRGAVWSGRWGFGGGALLVEGFERGEWYVA